MRIRQMPLHTISIRPTLKTILQLYRKNFFPLVKLVFPLLILAEVANLMAGHLSTPSAIGWSLLAWILNTLADIRALKFFLTQAGHQVTSLSSVSTTTFVAFLFVTFYIDIASSLAGFFLLFPALLVFASALLAPALIIIQGQGPFEAIAESADQTRGNVWRISGLLLAIGIPLLILSAGIGALESLDSLASSAINFVFSIVAALLGLLTYAATAVVYVEVQPDLTLPNDASPN